MGTPKLNVSMTERVIAITAAMAMDELNKEQK